MNPALRTSKIASYGDAYVQLIEALSQFPGEMWQFRDEHGCWSIHEHVVHIADSEINSYIRWRRLIAEPGEPLMAYDENRWADALNYHEQSTGDALEIFRWLRRKSHTPIESLPKDVWSNSAYHPENGTMTLDDWLDVYEGHVREHIEYMQQNLAAWSQQR